MLHKSYGTCSLTESVFCTHTDFTFVWYVHHTLKRFFRDR